MTENQIVIGQPEIVAALAAAIATTPCPDCNADTERSTDPDGTQYLTVLHDDTCPTYREMTS